jgi:hypothetical protein
LSAKWRRIKAVFFLFPLAHTLLNSERYSSLPDFIKQKQIISAVKVGVLKVRPGVSGQDSSSDTGTRSVGFTALHERIPFQPSLNNP